MPNHASHHHDGAGNASAGSAPTTNAAARPDQVLLRCAGLACDAEGIDGVNAAMTSGRLTHTQSAACRSTRDRASQARYGESAMQVLTAPASFGHSDCERIVDGALAQPVLAVNSLAYVAAGIAVLCWAMRLRVPLAGTAGVVLVAVGAGSDVFHGPQPSWAGLAHDWPIFAAAAVYTVGLARSRRPQWRTTWAAAAGVFALGLAAYVAGRSGSPLCRPDSLWQYHGAWHVLSAAAAGWAARAMAPDRAVTVNHLPI